MPSPRRRPAVPPVLVAVLAVVALAAAGCSWFGGSDAVRPDGSSRILVVGDSVTALSEHDLDHQFAWAGSLDVRATSGATTAELLDQARAGADAHPEVGIFMPGYNDILASQAGTHALDQMMGVAAGLPCAIWFTLPRDGGYRASQVAIWNERIDRLAAEHANVVVDRSWEKLVERSPSFTFVKHVDAVHPNAQGQQAIAEVMSTAARHGCPG